MAFKKAALWMAGVLALVLSGCYSPDFADIEHAMTRQKVRALDKGFEEFHGTYQIGIPDVLTINVPDHPDLSGTYEVRPDGNITFTLLGDVYVEGKTPMQLGALLAERLLRFVREVEVFVTVTDSRSKQVYVFDRTRQSGMSMVFSGDVSALDAIAATGGWNRQVRAGKIRLIREDPDKPEKAVIYRIQGDKMVRGDLTSNVLLKENDMVYLPAHVGAEITYVIDSIFAPFRSIVTGATQLGESPFAIQTGYLQWEERKERADRY